MSALDPTPALLASLFLVLLGGAMEIFRQSRIALVLLGFSLACLGIAIAVVLPCTLSLDRCLV